MQNKNYTKEEERYLLSARAAGESYERIAQTLGRTKNALYAKLCTLKKAEEETIVIEGESPKLFTQEKTIQDFDPRDMFKELYNRGYRIDDKGVYVMVKKYVNLLSIISE